MACGRFLVDPGISGLVPRVIHTWIVNLHLVARKRWRKEIGSGLRVPHLTRGGSLDADLEHATSRSRRRKKP